MDHPLLARTLDILERLIAFDTRSSESNLPLIEYVRGALHGYGIESTPIHDASGTKANLYATIGPKDRPGLCLSGHTDVVPAAGQPWTVPAFHMTRASDRVLGRGAADMKGYLAVMLAMVPRFIDASRQTPVHLAFSYDEEVGCLGVRGLLSQLAAAPVKPLACIIGEPTSMQVVDAHKGPVRWHVDVKGRAAHSSMATLGVNALTYAARLVIDHGASGAPVFDCEGRVAAVISTVITQTLATPFGEMRIPTPWGSPNVVSVPVQQLMEFSEAQ